MVDAQILPKNKILNSHFSLTEKLDTRRKRRQQKARDEKRREKRIAEEENKKYLGRFPTPKIHIESHHDFPQFKQSTPEGATAACSSSYQHQRTDSESTPRSLSPVSSSSIVGSLNESGGMSFAKVKICVFCCVIYANYCLFLSNYVY